MPTITNPAIEALEAAMSRILEELEKAKATGSLLTSLNNRSVMSSKETDLEFLRGYRIGLEFALRTAKGIEANSPKTIEVCGE